LFGNKRIAQILIYLHQTNQDYISQL